MALWKEVKERLSLRPGAEDKPLFGPEPPQVAVGAAGRNDALDEFLEEFRRQPLVRRISGQVEFRFEYRGGRLDAVLRMRVEDARAEEFAGLKVKIFPPEFPRGIRFTLDGVREEDDGHWHLRLVRPSQFEEAFIRRRIVEGSAEIGSLRLRTGAEIALIHNPRWTAAQPESGAERT